MLYQLSYFRKIYRIRVSPPREGPYWRPASGFATPTGSSLFFEWEVMDSNHRRRKPADLQSAPFGHSGNFPLSCAPFRNRLAATSSGPPRVGLRADGGIRTHDQLITNQLLWPTELHRQYPPFWIAKVGIKNLSTKLFGINFPLFNSSQRTPSDRFRFTGEIGCKVRKTFE